MPVGDQDVDDAGVLDDAGAALPGTFGQRAGQVGRVGFPVGGQPDRADEVVDTHDGIAVESLAPA